MQHSLGHIFNTALEHPVQQIPSITFSSEINTDSAILVALSNSGILIFFFSFLFSYLNTRQIHSQHRHQGKECYKWDINHNQNPFQQQKADCVQSFTCNKASGDYRLNVQ